MQVFIILISIIIDNSRAGQTAKVIVALTEDELAVLIKSSGAMREFLSTFRITVCACRLALNGLVLRLKNYAQGAAHCRAIPPLFSAVSLSFAVILLIAKKK